MKCQSDIYDETQQLAADEREAMVDAGQELLYKLAQVKVIKKHLNELTQQKKHIEGLCDAQKRLLEALKNDVTCLMFDLDISQVEIDGMTAKATMSRTTIIDEEAALKAIEERGIQRHFMKLGATNLKQYKLGEFLTVEKNPSVIFTLEKEV